MNYSEIERTIDDIITNGQHSRIRAGHIGLAAVGALTVIGALVDARYALAEHFSERNFHIEDTALLLAGTEECHDQIGDSKERLAACIQDILKNANR